MPKTSKTSEKSRKSPEPSKANPVPRRKPGRPLGSKNAPKSGSGLLTNALRTKTAKPLRSGKAPKTVRADKPAASRRAAPAAPKSQRAAASPSARSAPRSIKSSPVSAHLPAHKQRHRIKLQTTCDPALLIRIDKAAHKLGMKRSRWYEMVALKELDGLASSFSPYAMDSPALARFRSLATGLLLRQEAKSISLSEERAAIMALDDVWITLQPDEQELLDREADERYPILQATKASPRT